MSDRKHQRLAATEATGERLKALFDDPAVSRWFDGTDDHYVDMLIAAKTDDERREWAAMARALRELRTFVDGAVTDGARARKELDEMR